MVIAAEKFERLVVDAIETSNEYQFKYILNVLKVNPEQTQPCLNNLSIFEKVLRTPGSKSFIEMCIKAGCNLYEKNAQEIFPLQYAIESLDADNLKTFLESFEPSNGSDHASSSSVINLGFHASSSSLPADEVKITIEEEEEREKKPVAADNLSLKIFKNGEALRSMIHSEKIEADNLPTSVCRTRYFDKIHKSQIVNEKFESGNNYLHILIDQLSDENHGEVSEMIKLMVVNKCNINVPNDRLETPFYLLLKKPRSLNTESDLVEFFFENANVDFYSYRSDEIIKFIEECNLRDRINTRDEIARDLIFMTDQLEAWNERKFIDEFETFSTESRCEQNSLALLLEAAIARNFKDAVKLLLTYGADVNGIPKGSKFNVLPSFVACSFGHHEVLKLLLRQPAVRFKSGKQSLLQQICLPGKIHSKDRQKCFELIIADPRCTSDIINSFDDQGFVPLFYACHYGFDEIAKELLRRGAFIGHESVINNISKEVLEEFLDECIKCSKGIRDKNCEITIDYRFLVPCDARADVHLEVQTVHKIATNPTLKDLTLHPTISSFLNIKWRKINYFVYFNLLAYFFFMIFLGVFIINFFHDPIYSSKPAVQGDTVYNAFSQGFAPSIPFPSTPFTTPPLFNESELDTNSSSFDDRFLMHENDNEPVWQIPPGGGAGAFGGGGGFGPSPEISHETTVEPETFEKPGAFDIILTLFGLKSSSGRSKRSTDNVMAVKLEDYLVENRASYLICLFGIFLMIIYETAQFSMSWRRYFFKISNWLDIILIVLSVTVLLFNASIPIEDFKKIRAVTVLVMAAQSIQLVAKVSFLSMSLHMAIFKRVCKTFLKTIALYLILILAFAMSFYTLNDHGEEEQNASKYSFGPNDEKDDEKVFSNAFISVITIVRMMLSDFENIKIDPKDHFQGFMFLLFVVLITVVLFNLLNALAISDTHKIMMEAELVNTKKRISNLYTYEKLFAMMQLSFANIFPKYSFISLTPNKNNKIMFEKIPEDPFCASKIASKFNAIDTAVKILQSKGTTATMGVNSLKSIVDFVKSSKQID